MATLGRVALRRRKASGLVDYLFDLQQQVDEIQTLFSRYNEFTIQGPEDEEERSIRIGSNSLQTFIESSNYDFVSQGFRLRSDGRADFYGGILVGGIGSVPFQLQLIGSIDGDWITQSNWDSDTGTSWQLGTLGYGDIGNSTIDEYGDYVLKKDDKVLFRAKHSTHTVPQITYPNVIEKTDIGIPGTVINAVDIQFSASTRNDWLGFRGFGSFQSPTTVEQKTFTAENGETLRIEEFWFHDDEDYLELDIRPFKSGAEPRSITDIFPVNLTENTDTIIRLRGVDEEVDWIGAISNADYVTAVQGRTDRHRSVFEWRDLNPQFEIIDGRRYAITMWEQEIDERRIDGGKIHFDEDYTSARVINTSTNEAYPNRYYLFYATDDPASITLPGLTGSSIHSIETLWASAGSSIILNASRDFRTVSGLKIKYKRYR